MKLTSMIAVLAFAFAAQAEEPMAPAATSPAAPAMSEPAPAHTGAHAKKDGKHKKHAKKEKAATH